MVHAICSSSVSCARSAAAAVMASAGSGHWHVRQPAGCCKLVTTSTQKAHIAWGGRTSCDKAGTVTRAARGDGNGHIRSFKAAIEAIRDIHKPIRQHKSAFWENWGPLRWRRRHGASWAPKPAFERTAATRPVLVSPIRACPGLAAQQSQREHRQRAAQARAPLTQLAAVRAGARRRCHGPRGPCKS